MFLKATATDMIQPSVPIVYAEPIDFEDFLFDRQTDELLNFVNRHSDKIKDEIKMAQIAKRRRIRDAISTTVFAAVTFFTCVGIYTCFGWLIH